MELLQDQPYELRRQAVERAQDVQVLGGFNLEGGGGESERAKEREQERAKGRKKESKRACASEENECERWGEAVRCSSSALG